MAKLWAKPRLPIVKVSKNFSVKSKFFQATIVEPKQFMTKTDMTIETEARTALPAITICLNSMHSRRTEKMIFLETLLLKGFRSKKKHFDKNSLI